MTSPDTSTPAPTPAAPPPAHPAPRAPGTFRHRLTQVRHAFAGYFSSFPTRRDFWIAFLLLFALGLFLRFWRIGYQSYWTDESHTIYRIFGDYARMLRRLDDQGFPPGWYTLLHWFAGFQEWRLGSGAAAFAPESLRLLPALLGTLTVPAMYLLARQFTDRRGSLLVMLLAAVNPFLIYYARDIKMYAALWLFATLNMALFFQWQSSRSWWQALWFPLYVITGCLATAMHGMAWIPIALQLVFVLTRPRPRPLDAPLWVIGLVFVSLLPIWWYDNGTKWLDNAVEGDRTGLEWNANYTDMNWRTIASLPSSHVLGVLWPEEPPSPRTIDWFNMDENIAAHMDTRAWHWLTTLEFWAILALFAVLLLGLFPWRGRRHDPARDASVTRGRWWWLALWIVLPTLGIGLTWLTPTGHASVTSAAAIADRKAPLTAAGLAGKLTSGSFDVRIAKPSEHRGFHATVPITFDGPNPATLESLAAAIRTAGRENRGDPRQAPERLSVSITPSGQLEIKARENRVVTFHHDTSGVLSALGIPLVPPEPSWYQLIWGWKNKPPPRVWEPRYLGVILPAMLLWCAAALRRLPSLPVRVLLITATVGLCTFSALSNHLIYRNTPYEQVAQAVLKYRQKSPTGELPDPQRVAWNNPAGQALRLQDLFTLQIRSGIRPWATQRGDDPPPGQFFAPLYHDVPTNRPGQTRREPDSLFWNYRDVSRGPGPYPPDDGYDKVRGYLNFLGEARRTPNVAAIVFTDRLGDLPDTLRKPDGSTIPNPLSNDALGKLLGPDWRLDYETRYRWHYEWRYNIFHTWRTRVWLRTSLSTAPTTTTTTTNPTTRPSTTSKPAL